jgi:DNA-binding transcriptional ArsR family regulator
VITLELAAEDLAATRFTISPLNETVASLLSLYGCPVVSRSHWAHDVRRRPELAQDVLRSLVSPIGWMPDFLSPAPEHARPSIEEQLAQVRATPPEVVVADVRGAYPDGDLPAVLSGLERDPIAVRDAMADVLADYWEIVVAPHWARMKAILEADLLYRGLQFAELGAGAAFAQLDPSISWTGTGLQIDIVEAWRRHVPAAGRVVQLIPTVFLPRPSVPIDIDAAPLIIYPSRRSGLMWHEVTPAASSAICSLLGRRRASVLISLDQPRSTTEIAHLMAVTPGAVSQHLALLSTIGLVERARVGRVVLYSQSPLARQLLEHSAWAEAEGIDERGDLTA